MLNSVVQKTAEEDEVIWSLEHQIYGSILERVVLHVAENWFLNKQERNRLLSIEMTNIIESRTYLRGEETAEKEPVDDDQRLAIQAMHKFMT